LGNYDYEDGTDFSIDMGGLVLNDLGAKVFPGFVVGEKLTFDIESGNALCTTGDDQIIAIDPQWGKLFE
jgi:hypothetical protein